MPSLTVRDLRIYTEVRQVQGSVQGLLRAGRVRHWQDRELLRSADRDSRRSHYRVAERGRARRTRHHRSGTDVSACALQVLNLQRRYYWRLLHTRTAHLRVSLP